MTKDQDYSVHAWQGAYPPDENEMRRFLEQQGLAGYRWSNGPGDVYGAHSHPFNKIIFVLQGSITFILPDLEAEVLLGIGDQLDLPAGIVHEAVVGQQGVICIEAHSHK